MPARKASCGNCRLPIGCDCEYKLALLAATIAGPGTPPADSLGKAFMLLVESGVFLGRMESNALFGQPVFTLEAAREMLTLKSKRRLREYLQELCSAREAADIWARGLKGEAVLSSILFRDIEALRTTAVTDRNRRATASRAKKRRRNLPADK